MKNQHETPEALAHALFTAAQLTPGEGIEDAVGRLAALVEAQQPTQAQAGAVQRQMDARHAAIYRWIIQHIDKAASIIDAWREDGEADKDELHDALAARAAKQGANHD